MISKFRIDYSALNISLANETWNQVLASTDPNTSFNLFVSILKTYIDVHCHSYLINSNKLLKPWMSSKIRKLIELKNKLYKKVKNNPLNIPLKTRYSKLKKLVYHINIQTRNDYYTRKFKAHMGNPRKQWEIINSVVGEESKRKMKIFCIKDEYDVEHLDQAVIANLFNDFFVKVPLQLNNSIDKVSCTAQEESDMKFSNYIEPTTCFFAPVDGCEILSLISGLKNTDASGFDEISNRTVKQIALNIVAPLEHIFNLSLCNGIFPTEMKRAVILPLFKNGNSTNMSNFRPISLLSVFSKILEKIMKKRIFEFLNKTKFLSNCQFGFRPNLGTEEALLCYFNDVYANLNSNRKVAGLFIDVTKAFDTVNHELLLDKLYMAGFRGVPLNMLKSFLSSRPQSVMINGVLSDIKFSVCGVPQGSVLGPILFLVYINSLCKYKFTGKVVAFADDTAFSYQAENWNQTLLYLKEDLSTLKKWFSIHSMVLSSKTRFIPFLMQNQIDGTPDVISLHSSYCVLNRCDDQCVVIKKVDMFKYLGVCIDSKLNFGAHTAKLSRLIKSTVRKFYILRELCPRALLKSIYFALINSRLDYGLALWGGAVYETLKKLIVSQKYILRIMYRKRSQDHTFHLFVESQILPLRYLYCYKVLKVFYNRGGYERVRSIERYNLRLNNQCIVDFTRKEYCRRFFIFKAPTLYNILPLEIKASSSKLEFLRNLKKWLLSFDNHLQIESFL